MNLLRFHVCATDSTKSAPAMQVQNTNLKLTHVYHKWHVNSRVSVAICLWAHNKCSLHVGTYQSYPTPDLIAAPTATRVVRVLASQSCNLCLIKRQVRVVPGHAIPHRGVLTAAIQDVPKRAGASAKPTLECCLTLEEDQDIWSRVEEEEDKDRFWPALVTNDDDLLTCKTR